MKRSWAVAGAVSAVLAVGIALVALDSGSSASHSAAGLAYVTGLPGSRPVVWLASADGRDARRLGPGATPLLSPDGATVAASTTTARGAALTLYGSGPPRELFDAAVQTAQPLAWSPDSRYLAVALTGRDPASVAASGLAVVDTETGAIRTIAHGSIHGASFAPGSSDRLAYAVAHTTSLTAATNVYIAHVDGSGTRALTRNGMSLNPVWGEGGIAYDVERPRTDGLPLYEVWLAAPGSGAGRQVTHIDAPPLRNGLVPLAFSDSGARLVAEYIGLDTSEAWTIAVASDRVQQLRVAGNPVAGADISSDGSAVLVDSGGFLEPPSFGRIEAVPFDGGPAHLLVAHGAEPTWNR